MKIKSIATICKKNKQVVLFNRYSDISVLSPPEPLVTRGFSGL